jgi:hypothetical protein
MTKIVVVEKTGTLKEVDVKLNDTSELYKKAGFKSAEGFILQTNWVSTSKKCAYDVSLYAKTTGRAGQENKYDFPPPVDDKLFFGCCVLVAKNSETNEMVNLTKEHWNQCYEHLFGGFEDLGDEDSEMSEDDVDDDVSRTKEGYVKDGFIVDDSELELEDDEDEDTDETELDDSEEDDEEEEEEEEDDFEEEEEEAPKKSKKAKKPLRSEAKPIKIAAKPKNAFVEPPEKKPRAKKAEAESKGKIVKTNSSNYLNCSDELVEEDYI